MSEVLSATTDTPSVLQDMPISIPPYTSPILSTSSRLHTTRTSPHSFIRQLDTPSIPTISSLETSTPIPTHISSPLPPIDSTYSAIIPPLSMEIPILETSHPKPLMIVHE